MYTNLKKAWSEVVQAEDLDNHLDSIGQAIVNAKTVEEMLIDFPLSKNSRVLIPGCGTGQILDYLSSTVFLHNHLHFTDINKSFLDKLLLRLQSQDNFKYKLSIDDIENSVIKEEYCGVIAVLLLEQLDWKRAIYSITSYNPKNIYLIIQEQDFSSKTVTVNFRTPKSILEFSKIAEPQLVPKDELVEYLKNRNYSLRRTYKNTVPNNKTMVGVVFSKNNTI